MLALAVTWLAHVEMNSSFVTASELSASVVVGGSDMCFVLDPTARQSSFDLPIGTGTVRLLVGPEGGWDRSEIEAFEHLACRFVSLGPRILRVETAALVGAAALLVTPSVDTL